MTGMFKQQAPPKGEKNDVLNNTVNVGQISARIQYTEEDEEDMKEVIKLMTENIMAQSKEMLKMKGENKKQFDNGKVLGLKDS